MEEVDFSIEINRLLSSRGASVDERSGPGEPTETLPYLWFATHGTHLDGEGWRGEEGGVEGGRSRWLKPPGFTWATSGT